MTLRPHSKSKLICHVILALLLLTSQALTGDKIWTGHGPFFVQLLSLEVSSANPKVLYATGYSGATRSTDGGVSWRQLNVPSDVLKPHPKNGKIVFSASGSSFYISRDQGITWQKLSDAAFEATVLDLEIDPNNPDTIYAARSGYKEKTFGVIPAVVRSIDGGRTWSKVLEAPCCGADFLTTIAHVELEPENPNIIYASFNQHFFYSSDKGATWQKLSSKFYIDELRSAGQNILYAGNRKGVWKSTNSGKDWVFTGGRCGPHISVDRWHPEIVYATGYLNNSPNKCTRKSSDGGKTWQDLNLPHPWNLLSVNLIEVNPRNSNEIYAASDLFYRSVNGGTNWRTIVNSRGGGCAVLNFDLKNPPTLFASKDNHLFKSISGKGKWTILNTPVEFTFVDLAIHPADPSFIVGAGGNTPVNAVAEKALILSFDGGTSWRYMTAPFRVAQSVVLNPKNPNMIQIAGDCPGETVTCVATSMDRGKTWQVNKTPGPSFYSTLEMHPTDPSILYLAGSGAFRSNDGGKTWKVKSQGIPKEDFIFSLSVGPKHIYAAGFRDNSNIRIIYRTDLSMSKWIPLIDVGDLSGGGYVNVWAHPTDPETVLAGGPSRLVMSTDAGKTWSSVTNAGLMKRNGICDLAISPLHPDVIFGSFDTGVLWLNLSN